MQFIKVQSLINTLHSEHQHITTFQRVHKSHVSLLIDLWKPQFINQLKQHRTNKQCCAVVLHIFRALNRQMCEHWISNSSGLWIYTVSWLLAPFSTEKKNALTMENQHHLSHPYAGFNHHYHLLWRPRSHWLISRRLSTCSSQAQWCPHIARKL